MVGGCARRYALDHSVVGSVTAIAGKKLGIAHPKLKQLHEDFADCCALGEPLSGQVGAIFCLGAHTGSVSDAECRMITVDSPVEFARVFRPSRPNVYIFCPAYIYPVEPRNEPNFSYRVMRAIYPAFRVHFPNQVIRVDDLAPAMVDVAVQETDDHRGRVFENRDILAMVE
jgi:hypothetical protein